MMPSERLRRVVLILPCCIGDVVLATAALAAFKRAYPQAHVTWAVSRWVQPFLAQHPLVDELLVTGDSHLPLYRAGEFVAFVRALRRGGYDGALSLVRSPLMSVALLASGIRVRAGLDSGGRGFGYTHKAKVRADETAHEMDVYLRVVAALGVPTAGALPVTPYDEGALARAFADLPPLPQPYVVANPAGGVNPGMTLVSKRYPPDMLARLLALAAADWGAGIVLVGGKGDAGVLAEAAAACAAQGIAPHVFDSLPLPTFTALATHARLYVGNDTGLTHWVAAAGAPTVMLMGPTDPARYAPRGLRALALRRDDAPAPQAVSQGVRAWDWARDGIAPERAWQQARAWAERSTSG